MTQVPYTVRWWLTAGQDVRRNAWLKRGAWLCPMDRQVMHGPVAR